MKREKAENYFRRDLEMRNDRYNVRIQDTGPFKRQEILRKNKPQLSSSNSFIYDVIYFQIYFFIYESNELTSPTSFQ